MKQREIFEKVLEDYYSHLLERFKNGGEYVDKNNCNEGSKEYKAYEWIINELKKHKVNSIKDVLIAMTDTNGKFIYQLHKDKGGN